RARATRPSPGRVQTREHPEPPGEPADDVGVPQRAEPRPAPHLGRRRPKQLLEPARVVSHVPLVYSEGGFAPLPKPPPRTDCAGGAGARTTVLAHRRGLDGPPLPRGLSVRRREGSGGRRAVGPGPWQAQAPRTGPPGS